MEQCLKALESGGLKRETCEYNEAIKHFEKALKIARKKGFKAFEGGALESLAFVFSAVGDQYKAIDYYERGLNIAQEIGDKKMEGAMYDGLGTTYLKLGKCHESMEYLKKAFVIAQSVGNSERIGTCYINLGTAFYASGEYQNAIKCHKKGLDIFIELNNKTCIGQCYGGLAMSYVGQGKYHDAIRYADEYLEIAMEMGDKSEIAKALNVQGQIYRYLNDLEREMESCQKSLIIAEEIGDKILQAQGYGNIGALYDVFGNHQDAIPHHLKSLKIAEAIGNKKIQATSTCNIANCYREMQQHREASKYYEKSLKLAKEINDKNAEATVYLNVALTHFLSSEFQQAISWLEKCLGIDNKRMQSHACSLLGQSYHALSKESQEQSQENVTKSEKYLKEALACFDYQFKHLQNRDEYKISFFESFHADTYKLLTAIFIETKRTQEALMMCDRGRARALVDRLIDQYGMVQEESLSSDHLKYPDVEVVLSNDTFSLLLYNLFNKSVDVWVLTKDSMNFIELDSQPFLSAVQEFHDGKKEKEIAVRAFANTVARAYDVMKVKEGVTCENRSLDTCVTLGDQSSNVSRDGTREVADNALEQHPLEMLFSCLISPVLTHVQHEEIVIVPEGPLYTIPFAALRDPGTGLFLSDTKRIRLAPSITILKLLQEYPASHHSQKGALIVGDPNVGEVMLRGEKITLGSLPSAKVEANVIARILHVNALTGDQATKDMILEKLREGAAVIHIAAHGSPDNGEIALAPTVSPDRQGIPDEQDYMLTMKEVQEIGIKAQLVVLSCCHSGRGEIRAEGVVGLTRAFLAAGARAVVASLWAIDDKVTLSFMVSFYACLYRGDSASVSLNKAMKDVRNEGYKQPKYWAPFFLIGDDVTIK